MMSGPHRYDVTSRPAIKLGLGLTRGQKGEPATGAQDGIILLESNPPGPGNMLLEANPPGPGNILLESS